MDQVTGQALATFKRLTAEDTNDSNGKPRDRLYAGIAVPVAGRVKGEQNAA
jgi:hypothetical protein